MRLWHKDLIPVLPKQQLLSQWRECCCIARNIAVNGTPNHLLVNKVLEYSSTDFSNYCGVVVGEMKSRGYKIGAASYNTLLYNIDISEKHFNNNAEFADIFDGWHNNRYFWQCYYNLQEKYDCGGISEEEWQKVKQLGLKKYGVGKLVEP